MNKLFIKATEKYSTADEFVSAPLFRKSFTLDFTPSEAKIKICGLGFYILYVNGIDVTKGHLAPYISNPDDVCYFDLYDVKEYLTVGENVIGIILGNGMNNAPGGAEWDFTLAEFRTAPRLALEFDAKSDDASLSFTARDGFLTHPSPILFDDLRMGEIYDARLELPFWNKANFDDSNWSQALTAEIPRGKMKLCEAEPIRVQKELAPVSITQEGDAYVYDFGTNSAGVEVLRIRGERGRKITLWHAEMLDKDGKFYNQNIRFFSKKCTYFDKFNQTDRFILSGGDDEYSPHFCYHGFRYVKVEGILPEEATPELLTYRVMSSDLKTVGGFECSDERINTVYRMVDNANRSNFFYFPTDCPQREKNGWTGDAAISAEQMTLMYDTERSYREWLTSIRLAMNERGELPGIVPTSGWGFAWGNGPTWDQVLFRLPYVTYKFRGSTELIRENAHSMIRYLEYILTRRSADGTVAIGLGDWVPVNKSSSDYDAPLALTDTIAVMEMARAAAEMLEAIGYTHGRDFAKAIYEDMRETVRRELVNPDTLEVAGKCQSSQAIALYYGVFNEDERDRAFSHLLNYIHAKDDTFDCGFIGMHCMFTVLSDIGESELAFKLLFGDKFPSYTLLIDDGHTALPEKFDCTGKHGLFSMNHHFLGDVSRWLTTRLAGLDIIDHKTVRIKPCPVSKISHASAYYDLPAGRASISWERTESGEIKVFYSVPDGVTVIK